jgi:hypothetical protein
VGEVVEGDAGAGSSGIDAAGERVGDHAEEGGVGGAEGDVHGEAGTVFEEGRRAIEGVDEPKHRPAPTLGVGGQVALLADDRDARGGERSEDGPVRGEVGGRDRGSIGFGTNQEGFRAGVEVPQELARTCDRGRDRLCPQNGKLYIGEQLHGGKIARG